MKMLHFLKKPGSREVFIKKLGGQVSEHWDEDMKWIKERVGQMHVTHRFSSDVVSALSVYYVLLETETRNIIVCVLLVGTVTKQQ